VEGANNYFDAGVKSVGGGFSIWKDRGGGSNNCENFTNVCVLGLNFSELSARNAGSSKTDFNVESCINEILENLMD